MQLAWRCGWLLGVTLCFNVQLSAQRPVDPTRPLISPPEPSIVCGMTILPVPHAVDEKMSKTPPSGQFNLQVRTPSVCRDMSRLPPLRTRDDLRNRLPTFLGPKR